MNSGFMIKFAFCIFIIGILCFGAGITMIYQSNQVNNNSEENTLDTEQQIEIQDESSQSQQDENGSESSDAQETEQMISKINDIVSEE